MIKNSFPTKLLWKIAQNCVAVLCIALLVPGDASLAASFQQQVTESDQQEVAKIPPDQLDSLVAPIALYPDPMLAQVLAASTYPLELVQLVTTHLQKQHSNCLRNDASPTQINAPRKAYQA